LLPSAGVYVLQREERLANCCARLADNFNSRRRVYGSQYLYWYKFWVY